MFLEAIEFYSTGLFTQFPNKKNDNFLIITHSIKWNIGIYQFVYII